MPVVSAERFATGLTWGEYLAGATEHQEQRRQIYESVTFTPAQREALAALRPLGLKVLVLEEYWCGDAARTGPVLARVAEEAGMEARWFFRDQNLDIMDQYLENGTSRAIPCFIFMTRDLEYLTHWGSRPRAVKEAARPLQPLPPQGDPARPAAFERFKQVLAAAYEKVMPHGVVDELLQYINTALQHKI
ncbi:MAG: thioredoxin family protein [Symbiobacterium sp.]|uniref:thioredoxin family protein n=1 Tax=Symbiobacterium sp. TaxID=1971213 RepID=UPI0034646FAF